MRLDRLNELYGLWNDLSARQMCIKLPAAFTFFSGTVTDIHLCCWSRFSSFVF